MEKKIPEIIVGLIVIYFGMKGGAAAKYFSHLSTYLDDKQGVINMIISWLYGLAPLASLIVVVSIFISFFLKDADDEKGPVGAVIKKRFLKNNLA